MFFDMLEKQLYFLTCCLISKTCEVLETESVESKGRNYRTKVKFGLFCVALV